MGRPLVVLQSFPAPKPTSNPYVAMLAASLAALPAVELRTFSWPRALLGRFDVFHAHWPENLVSGRTKPTILIRQALFLLLLAKLRVTRTPLVRTVHNVGLPGDLSAWQQFLLRLGERQTTLRIVLNPYTPVPGNAARETIIHGHYRDWFAGERRAEPEAGRILFFGLVRRYKGVDGLIRAFRAVTEDIGPVALRIAGRPTSHALASELADLAGGDPRVSLRFEYVSDPDLVDEVSRAELVVLPYPDMHNSGSLLAALSLDRPVLVPDNTMNRALAAEVGPGWVHTFAGEIAASDLIAALREARSDAARARPVLDDRGWATIGAAHLRAYQRARSLVRPPGRRAGR